MADDPVLKELKELITIELDHCNRSDWPYICKMISTPDGRQGVESMIIKQVVASGISVGQALERIERSYNPNMIED